jgi:hypothetical protein
MHRRATEVDPCKPSPQARVAAHQRALRDDQQARSPKGDECLAGSERTAPKDWILFVSATTREYVSSCGSCESELGIGDRSEGKPSTVAGGAWLLPPPRNRERQQQKEFHFPPPTNKFSTSATNTFSGLGGFDFAAATFSFVCRLRGTWMFTSGIPLIALAAATTQHYNISIWMSTPINVNPDGCQPPPRAG